MTTPVDVGIRMQILDNEVKRDVGQVRTEFQRLNHEVKTAGGAAKGTATDYDRLRIAAARTGDAVGTGLSRVLIAQHQHAGILSGSLGRLVTGYAALRVAQQGFTAVADIQDATKGFEGFVGSQREAVDLAKQLQNIKSPFGTSGIFAGAQELLAHNTAAGDVVSNLRAISDAVAGTGGNTSKLTSATSAIAALRSSTYLTSGALGALQSQGIPAVDLLAKAHGMTAEGLQRSLDGGGLKISGQAAADQLINAFTDRYKGQAVQQANSLRGVVQHLGNEASKSLAEAITPELPQITAFVNTLAADLPGLAHAASPFLHVLGDTLGMMADHPHLTEALGGFLLFREVAGPALRTAGAMVDMGRALKTMETSEGVLLLLKSLAGFPGVPGLPNSGGQSTLPPVVLPTPRDRKPRSSGKKSSSSSVGSEVADHAAALERAARSGARFGTRLGRLGLHVGSFAKHSFGGSPDAFNLGHPDIKGNDQSTADMVLQAQAEITARTGLRAKDLLSNRAKGKLTKDEQALLLGMPAFSAAKPGFLSSHVDFNAASANKALAGYAQTSVALSVNVTPTGSSGADIQKALLEHIKTPEFAKEVQAQIDADKRASAARHRTPFP